MTSVRQPAEPVPLPLRRAGESPGELLARIRGAAHETCQARRERVLAHPDLAEQLTRPPLNYASPEHWNGYVPPRMWAENLNTAPQRAALIRICAEAMDRENGHELLP